MRFDRGLTLGVFRPLRGGGAGRVPVLMYHSVSDDPETGVGAYYRVATSPARFGEQMQWLAELGYRGVSLEEALAAKSGGKLAAITFDDGFRDFQTAAWPALQRHGFTATMYLPTAYIGSQRKTFLNRECLTWDEVRALKKQGARFGSHTVNHPKLYEKSWADIENEVTQSKQQIEKELGEPITSFAYPYAFPQEDGRFAARLGGVLRQAGYQSCATTVIGSWQPGADALLLKRLPVNDCDDRALFAAKLAGAYDWMGCPQALVRRVKALLGRTHRRND